MALLFCLKGEKMLTYILVGVVCYFIGLLTYLVILKPNPVGNLRIDQSDPDDKPYLFLEIEQGKLNAIRNKKMIFLKVLDENYIPRK